MRSNVPAAKLQLGVDISLFYAKRKNRKYSVIYYGDYDKKESLVDMLKKEKNVCFARRWGEKRTDLCTLSMDDEQERSKVFSESKMIIIDNKDEPSFTQKIPTEITEAAAAGALVFTKPHKLVQETYGSSVVIYNNEQELLAKIKYYQQEHKNSEQNIVAQKIAAEKLSSKASAKRFYEIWKWLKENRASSFAD
jgi:hypothetical protein